MGDCFFGCDRCQEACPFNQQGSSAKFFLPATDELLGMTEDEFERRFGRTAFARAGLEKLKSNNSEKYQYKEPVTLTAFLNKTLIIIRKNF